MSVGRDDASRLFQSMGSATDSERRAEEEEEKEETTSDTAVRTGYREQR